MKEKFLTFIDTTNHYETDRLFGLLPSDGTLQIPSLFMPYADVA